MYIYRLNTKIRLTMLYLSGFELYSRWVPLCYDCLQCTMEGLNACKAAITQ